jgi:hypothetical protein
VTLCLTWAQSSIVLGLLFDIVGVFLLASPIIRHSCQYGRAKEIARRKAEAGAANQPVFDDDEIGFTAETLIWDVRLAWMGVGFASIGFLLQIVGSFLRI